MLPPSYLDAMPDAFVQLAQQVEDEILQDVQSPIANLARVLNQIAESKGGAAEA